MTTNGLVAKYYDHAAWDEIRAIEAAGEDWWREADVWCRDGQRRTVILRMIGESLGVLHETETHWNVTHVPSGRRVVGGLPSHQAAAVLATILNKLPIRWEDAVPDSGSLEPLVLALAQRVSQEAGPQPAMFSDDELWTIR